MDLENDLKSKTEDQQDMQEISGEVLKEIEKYGIIIDTSIEKIQNLFLKYHDTITPDQKQKLEYLENTLVQSKSTKNI
jgi:predicted glycosyltransferase